MAGPCLRSLRFCVLVCHFEKNHSLFCFVLNKGMPGFVGAGGWGGGSILREEPLQPFPGRPQRNQKLQRVGAAHLVLL